MVLGLSLAAFTTLHVTISFVALALGAGVLAGMLRGTDHGAMTAGFLATTILTSGTGFLFPATTVLPSHIVGILSLAVLVIAVAGYYAWNLTGASRRIYAVAALVAFYLNAFVAVVQAFLKIEALHALAPIGTEPPFIAAQTVLLAAFIATGFFAVKRFRPASEGMYHAPAAD